MKFSIIVGQSGGPTAVINASLAGIVENSLKNENIENVYGALNGIDGILSNNIIDFKYESSENINLLKTTPSAILGSVRFKLPDFHQDNSVYEKIKEKFIELNIKAFFYIGGNDSMDTCNKISEYFKLINFDCSVIGVPKTIDNDLVLTDHTPGFGSSIKYIATVVSEISHDISCYKKGKVTIVEIMGRDAGWLTAGAKLASLTSNGADLIYLPEVAFDMDDFLNRVNEIYKVKGHALIAVSEGIKDKNGQYILKYRTDTSADNFGHLQLGGVGSILAEFVHQRLNLSARNVELNLPQRCSSHIASLTDIKEAYNCGKYAVKFAIERKTGVMVSMKRVSNKPYKIKYVPVLLSSVANLVKEVNEEYISFDKTNITDKFIDYALPLINKEAKIKYQNGLPTFSKLEKHKI